MLANRRSRLHKALALILIAICGFAIPAVAQNQYTPSQSNLDARKWYQDAKFGMFIHWGIYSELGDGEWVMEVRHMSGGDYQKLAPQFYPVKFDPRQWVSLAKAAGMKYITVTSRHHDGFSMFETKQSDWNIVQRTPYAKDAIRMLADECHKQGIKVFFYYSQLDWHHPDYFPLGNTGYAAGRAKAGDWSRYLAFMNGQLTELLSNYGEVSGIWFDGMWDKPDTDWHLNETYSLIHRLQPQALIVANHHKKPIPGEDVQTFERDLPGENKSGFSGESTIGELPLETSDTVNGSWGYNLSDNSFKSPRELVRYLVRAAGRNANLLLNIGPMPNGEIPAEAVSRLQDVGKWLDKYGDSIYGTRGGPIPPAPWGVTTKKGNTVYVHVLEPSEPGILLPRMKVRSASLMANGAPVQFSESEFGMTLKLPPRGADEFDQIVVMQLGEK